MSSSHLLSWDEPSSSFLTNLLTPSLLKPQSSPANPFPSLCLSAARFHGPSSQFLLTLYTPACSPAALLPVSRATQPSSVLPGSLSIGGLKPPPLTLSSPHGPSSFPNPFQLLTHHTVSPCSDSPPAPLLPSNPLLDPHQSRTGSIPVSFLEMTLMVANTFRVMTMPQAQFYTLYTCPTSILVANA